MIPTEIGIFLSDRFTMCAKVMAGFKCDPDILKVKIEITVSESRMTLWLREVKNMVRNMVPTSSKRNLGKLRNFMICNDSNQFEKKTQTEAKTKQNKTKRKRNKNDPPRNENEARTDAFAK